MSSLNYDEALIALGLRLTLEALQSGQPDEWFSFEQILKVLRDEIVAPKMLPHPLDAVVVYKILQGLGGMTRTSAGYRWKSA
jgi:hypothetical protein